MCTCIYCVLCCFYCVFLYCFVYVCLFLFVLSVLVQGLLPPSDNSIAVSSSNNNTPANVLENENFQALLESQHTYGQNNTF